MRTRICLILAIIFLVGCLTKSPEVKLRSYNTNCAEIMENRLMKIFQGDERTIIKAHILIPNPCYKPEIKLEDKDVIINLTSDKGFCVQCLGSIEIEFEVLRMKNFNVKVFVDRREVTLNGN